MKHELFAACAGVVAVMAAGLSGTAAAAPPDLVPQGKLDSIILSADAVSSIVGAAMVSEQKFGRPAPPATVGDQPACAVINGVNSDTVGDDWEAFRDDFMKDSKGNDFNHLVDQIVALYSDTDTAAKLFQNAFQSVSGCTGTIHFKWSDGSTGDWQVKTAPTVTSSQAQWVMAQLDNNGNPFGWRCAYDTRVQSNVIFSAQVCQYGNPAGIAKKIADQMTAAISS